MFVKTFIQNENDNFDVLDDQQGVALKNQKNMTLDAHGNFIQINIEIIDNAKARRKPEDNLIVDKYVGNG